MPLVASRSSSNREPNPFGITPRAELRKRARFWLFVLAAEVLLAQDQRGVVLSTSAAADRAIQVAQLPRVVLLATGGTIASKHDPEKGGYTTALTGEQLLEAVPALKEVARLDVEQISNIPSTNVTSEIWLTLARRANELLARPDVAGVVVTHGTDTLEETAYFLDLTVTSDKPVVVVGAQRPASMLDSDGPRNLLNAIRVAASPEAAGKGAMVVMNGQINAARDVSKTSTVEVETFRSLEYGQLGVADFDQVRFYRTPLRRQTLPLSADTRLGRVEIVLQYAGADGRLIRGLLTQGTLDGLVVAGTGLGNVSEASFDAIKQVRDRGIPVVISTRVYTGRTSSLSAGKGSGKSLREIGCVQADNLNPQKARVLLLLALTRTKNPEKLQTYFDR